MKFKIINLIYKFIHTPPIEYKDYTNDVKVIKSKFLRFIFLSVGMFSLVLGILGIFLPVLPTTPFILLSMICYSKSSAKFYNLLLNNRFFGPHLRRWKYERCIPLKVKIFAISLLFITVGSSVIFFIKFVPAKIIVSCIALLVIFYISKFPSKPQR